MAYWQNIPDSMVAEYAPVWWRVFRRYRNNSRESSYRTLPSNALKAVASVFPTTSFTDILVFPVYLPDCYVGVLSTEIKLTFTLVAHSDEANPTLIRGDWRLTDGTYHSAEYTQSWTSNGPGSSHTETARPFTLSMTAPTGNAIRTITLQCKRVGTGVGTLWVDATWVGQSDYLRRVD